VANLEDFPDHFPTAAGGAGSPLCAERQPTQRAVILDAANAHAAPLYAVHTGVEPLRCPPSAASSGVQVALHETYADEIAWVAGEVARVHAQTPGCAGVTSGSSPTTTPTPPRYAAGWTRGAFRWKSWGSADCSPHRR
jgi:superfamily I DNA/RNA helicase